MVCSHKLYKIWANLLTLRKIILPKFLTIVASGVLSVTAQNNPYIVDVGMIWTSEAEQTFGSEDSIKSFLKSEISKVNTVLDNSEVNVVMNLVYLAPTDLKAVSSGEELNLMINETRKNTVDTIKAFMALNGIDHINFTQTQFFGSYSGIGGYGFSGANLEEALFYPYIYTHEFGHGLGCKHERLNESGGLPDQFNYAYSFYDNGNKFRFTVMYHATGTTEVVPYFSNPNISIDGVPLGIMEGSVDEAGNPNSADNARFINETGGEQASNWNNTGLNMAIIPKYNPIPAGEVQEYTVKWANSSNQSFYNISIEVLGQNNQQIIAADNGGAIIGNTVIWEGLGDIGPGEVGNATYGKTLTFQDRIQASPSGVIARSGRIYIDGTPQFGGVTIYFTDIGIPQNNISRAAANYLTNSQIQRVTEINFKDFEHLKIYNLKGKQIHFDGAMAEKRFLNNIVVLPHYSK